MHDPLTVRKGERLEKLGAIARQGTAVLMISSELPEVIGMGDRIVVMHRGRITAEYTRDEATADRVLQAAMGEQMETATR